MQIRLGTRSSQLALTQAHLVKAALENLNVDVQLVEIKTLGCRKQGTALASQTDKRDWVVDFEEALCANQIDLAIHSGKDIPAEIADGTTLLPVLTRANPCDVFIGRQINDQRLAFKDIKPGAKIGTASLRRQANLALLCPDIHVVEHRGNVPTRLKKLDESEALDGIVLAAAGIDRLGIAVDYEIFPIEHMLPAVNQGILVIQFCQDTTYQTLFEQLVDPVLYAVWLAEREVAIKLEGDCKSAMSIHASCEGEMLTLAARVMLPDGSACVEAQKSQPRAHAKALGQAVGDALLEQGAAKIIADSTHYCINT